MHYSPVRGPCTGGRARSFVSAPLDAELLCRPHPKTAYSRRQRDGSLLEYRGNLGDERKLLAGAQCAGVRIPLSREARMCSATSSASEITRSSSDVVAIAQSSGISSERRAPCGNSPTARLFELQPSNRAAPPPPSHCSSGVAEGGPSDRPARRLRRAGEVGAPIRLVPLSPQPLSRRLPV